MDFAKVQILGHVGSEPSITRDERGDQLKATAVLSVATNSRFTDSQGEKKEIANWHRVVVKNPHLVQLVEDRVDKGSQIQVFGNLQTRSWEENGEMRYITEVVVAGPEAQIIVHQGRGRAKEGQWTEKVEEEAKTTRKRAAAAAK